MQVRGLRVLRFSSKLIELRDGVFLVHGWEFHGELRVNFDLSLLFGGGNGIHEIKLEFFLEFSVVFLWRFVSHFLRVVFLLLDFLLFPIVIIIVVHLVIIL